MASVVIFLNISRQFLVKGQVPSSGNPVAKKELVSSREKKNCVFLQYTGNSDIAYGRTEHKASTVNPVEKGFISRVPLPAVELASCDTLTFLPGESHFSYCLL